MESGGVCRGRGGWGHPPSTAAPLPTLPLPQVRDPLLGTHPAWLWKGVGGPHGLEQRNQTSQPACTSVQPLDRLQLFPQPRLHKALGRGAPSPTGPTLPAPLLSVQARSWLQGQIGAEMGRGLGDRLPKCRKALLQESKDTETQGQRRDEAEGRGPQRRAGSGQPG